MHSHSALQIPDKSTRRVTRQCAPSVKPYSVKSKNSAGSSAVGFSDELPATLVRHGGVEGCTGRVKGRVDEFILVAHELIVIQPVAFVLTTSAQ